MEAKARMAVEALEPEEAEAVTVAAEAIELFAFVPRELWRGFPASLMDNPWR